MHPMLQRGEADAGARYAWIITRDNLAVLHRENLDGGAGRGRGRFRAARRLRRTERRMYRNTLQRQAAVIAVPSHTLGSQTMIHPIADPSPMPSGYARLSDREPAFGTHPGNLLVVSCAVCAMTMYASSPNALVHSDDESIMCRSCAAAGAIVRPLGVPHA